MAGDGSQSVSLVANMLYLLQPNNCLNVGQLPGKKRYRNVIEGLTVDLSKYFQGEDLVAALF